jgi:hypothetical protein
MRTFITPDEAENMLADGERIHTFRQAGFILLGCDVDRQDIVDMLKTFTPELSGEQATAMNHGLVIEDDKGFMFIETKAALARVREGEK